MKSISLIPVVAVLYLLAGCCPTHPPAEKTTAWLGPTDSMAKVISDINANNSKIPTLFAHHYYEADVVDDKKHSHHVAGDGVLLYQAPISIRLRASAAAVGTVFEIGSNPRSFWFELGPDTGSTLWWGNYADLSQIDPDSAGIPIRPDMVRDVLGIATINTNFSELPAPTMRFNAEKDAYDFVWIAKRPDRWVALREVWYDRVTKRPRLVLLYDSNGRVVLRATFDPQQYRQIQVPNLAKSEWPWMPGDYRLEFPDTGSLLRMTLDQAQLTSNMGNGVTIPNASSFRMPNPDNAPVDKVIRIAAPAER
ncbi:MAG TPA: hypothetical protein VG326_20485 [Tepidisphaeraceae bacterium]|jgi:hypothetical protein|nr:hypothetical protein [Tepidisphaeraceae bacterium]